MAQAPENRAAKSFANYACDSRFVPALFGQVVSQMTVVEQDRMVAALLGITQMLAIKYSYGAFTTEQERLLYQLCADIWRVAESSYLTVPPDLV